MAIENPRGQCTLESAIALILFVTLIAGLYSWSDVTVRLFKSTTLSRPVP